MEYPCICPKPLPNRYNTGLLIVNSNNTLYPADQSYINRISTRLTQLIASIPANEIAYQVGDRPFIDLAPTNPNTTVLAIQQWFAVNSWQQSALPPHNFMMSELFGPASINTGPSNFIPPPDVNLINSEVVPYIGLQGSPGQGNSNPRAEFRNHAIYVKGNKVFDPSYGSPIYNSQSEWEQASLTGYGVSVTFSISANANSAGTMMIFRTINFDEFENNSIQTNFFIQTP